MIYTDLNEILSFKEELPGYELKQQKDVIIDFWAPWCGPCKKAAPDFEELSEDNQDITFVKINIDENTEIATIFGIRSIPTFVYLSTTKPPTISVGYSSKQHLQDFINHMKG